MNNGGPGDDESHLSWQERERRREQRRRQQARKRRRDEDDGSGVDDFLDSADAVAGGASAIPGSSWIGRGGSSRGSSNGTGGCGWGGSGGGRSGGSGNGCGSGGSSRGGGGGDGCDACDCNFTLLHLMRVSTLLLVAGRLLPDVGSRSLVRGAIRGYRRWLTRFTPRCPQTPSCSAYALTAVEVLGPRRGLLVAARRVGNCGRPVG